MGLNQNESWISFFFDFLSFSGEILDGFSDKSKLFALMPMREEGDKSLWMSEILSYKTPGTRQKEKKGSLPF